MREIEPEVDGHTLGDGKRQNAHSHKGLSIPLLQDSRRL